MTAREFVAAIESFSPLMDDAQRREVIAFAMSVLGNCSKRVEEKRRRNAMQRFMEEQVLGMAGPEQRRAFERRAREP